MEDAKGQLILNAARKYQSFFVPALFGEWGDRLAAQIPLKPGQRALDVACGTGVLASALARSAPGATVIGCDRNAAMLSVARETHAGVEWREASAEALPFEDGYFDAVVSQFGLMFFDDREKAVREMWRVLAPGGRLLIAVWASLEETPGYLAMVGLLQRLFGEAVAAELRAPYSLGDPAQVRELCEAAGISGARLQTQPGTARFPSIADWVQTDVKAWTLADRIDDAQLHTLQQAAAKELPPFTTPEGHVEFAAPALVVAADK